MLFRVKRNLRQQFALIGFFVLFALPALANDSAIDVYGGSAKMRNPGNTEVAMLSETVIITLGQKNYNVDATFEFFNYGKTETINVGFPQTGYNGKKDATLYNFQTWINGKRVEVKCLPTLVVFHGEEYPEEKLPITNEDTWLLHKVRWLVKQVPFPGNQKTITRVNYNAPYGESWQLLNYRFLEYVYGTGKPWKGNIGKATFIIKLFDSSIRKPNLKSVDFGKDVKFETIRVDELQYEYILKDFEPHDWATMDVELDFFWPIWAKINKIAEYVKRSYEDFPKKESVK